jgi:hypothetical protein
LFESGPSEREVPVRVESSTTIKEKPDDVETCSRYDDAPDEATQLTVGLVEIPVALFVGEERVGTEGIAAIVVKEAVDHKLVPPAFVAFTCQ